MFVKLKNLISSFFKSVLKNQQLNTYFLFFVISFSFWFLTMLSKIHEATFTVPITYINYPVDLTEVVQPADFIQVRAKASGITIISFYLFSNNPLVLNYNLANSQPLPNGKKLFWIMNSKRKEIIEILGSSTEIMSCTPERIVVPFVNKIKKSVPIILNQDINLKQTFWLTNAIKLNPSYVTLYGEEALLDSINYVTTDLLKLHEVDKNQVHKVPLFLPNGLKSNVDSVLLELNVESFVEEVLTQEVEIRNLKKGHSMKLFPRDVSVVLRMPKNKYQLLKTKFLRLYVDASDLKNKKKIQINYDNLPERVKVERIYPNHLEFLLIKE